jgi:cytochrome c oxidase subunit 4
MMRNPASALFRRSLGVPAARIAMPRMAVRAASIAAAPPVDLASSSSSSSTPNRPLSNPTLANIEKRWEGMPLQEQADLWMALRDRMQGNWTELTVQEKKAAYWIAFGPHGPRAQDPPDFQLKVFLTVLGAFAVTGVIFGLMRWAANPVPHTMSREWQEASNEFLKAQKADPISGLTSPGYSGPGQVQSPSTGYRYGEGGDDDE